MKANVNVISIINITCSVWLKRVGVREVQYCITYPFETFSPSVLALRHQFGAMGQRCKYAGGGRFERERFPLEVHRVCSMLHQDVHWNGRQEYHLTTASSWIASRRQSAEPSDFRNSNRSDSNPEFQGYSGIMQEPYPSWTTLPVVSKAVQLRFSSFHCHVRYRLLKFGDLPCRGHHFQGQIKPFTNERRVQTYTYPGCGHDGCHPSAPWGSAAGQSVDHRSLINYCCLPTRLYRRSQLCTQCQKHFLWVICDTQRQLWQTCLSQNITDKNSNQFRGADVMRWANGWVMRWANWWQNF